MTDDELFRTGGAIDALPNHAEELVSRLKGRVLSGYRVGDIIGSGGMGFVLRASRAEGDFERIAAIKVVPGTLGSSEIAQRFRTEVQILARLNHPSIAQLYDAGETEEGWPYLVMEYVDGQPIDEFSTVNSLDVASRVDLLIEVARAVRFAHARLIVHRDLKPSNVLVDGSGRVKLLDFGIAKLLEPGTPEHTIGHRPMTPRYASPEQLLGADITTGSDIYQLGVLMLAVVAEETPMQSATLQDAIRNAAAGKDAAVAEHVAKRVPPDLLAIATHCLHANAEDRFADVNALIADLTRYREGYPVLARKGSRAYRLKKLVQRNVPATAFAVLAAVIGVGGSASYAINMSEARQVAEQRAETANRVLTAMSSLVTQTFDDFIDQNAQRQTGTAAIVESVLSDTVTLLRDELAEEPIARSELLRVESGIHTALGDFPAAALTLDEAISLAFDTADAESKVQMLSARAEIALYLEEIEEARQFVGRASTIADAADIDAATRVTFKHVSGFLAAKENRIDDALSILAEAERLALDPAVADDRALLDVYGTQLSAHDLANDFPAVLDTANKALEVIDETESEFSSSRVTPLRMAARANVLLGDLPAARAALDEALAIATSNFGEVHNLVAGVHHTFGLLEYYSKNLRAAVQHVEQEMEILEALYGPDFRGLLVLAGNVGMLYTDIGEMSKAEAMLRQQRDALDPDALEHRHSWYTNASNEARRLRAVGDYERAIEFEELKIRYGTLMFGADSIEVADAEDDIALSLHSLGRYDEAREVFLRGADRYRQYYGEDSEEYTDKMLYYWRYDLVDGNLIAARDKLRILMQEDIDADEIDAIWPVHMFTDLAHINLQIGDMPRANKAIDWARTGADTAPVHPWAAYTDLVEAEIRLAEGNTAEARRLARSASALIEERYPLHTRRLARAQAVLQATG
ncbi:MAG: serine/threonine-protein kinase [Pseudomonadota bacterium]